MRSLVSGIYRWRRASVEAWEEDAKKVGDVLVDFGARTGELGEMKGIQLPLVVVPYVQSGRALRENGKHPRLLHSK